MAVDQLVDYHLGASAMPSAAPHLYMYVWMGLTTTTSVLVENYVDINNMSSYGSIHIYTYIHMQT